MVWVAMVLWRLPWHLSTFVAANHGCFVEHGILTDDAHMQITNMGILT